MGHQQRMRASRRLGTILTGLFVLTSCQDGEASGDTDTDPAATTGGGGSADGTDTDDSAMLPPLPDGHARVNHSFGNYTLAPNEEIQPCIQWTLDNDEPVYVNRVVLTNNGGYHHSNWFVVPEDLFPAEDGFVDCNEAGFSEIEAAISGTVLFAQSTQSRIDELKLPEGVVVKIPPRHKIVAGGHLLNLANAEYDTELRMHLEIVHPREVDVVAAPFRLTYADLEIPRMSESRFYADCDLNSAYENAAGVPLDLKLYYVIPHYHYLGNYFDLSILGGERDGQSIFRMEGFNPDGSGQAYDPPIDLSGATGVQFTCGYDNWRNVDVGWGIGDQEMCVMLGLADSRVLMDGSVLSGNTQVDIVDGVKMNSSACGVIGLPKHEDQTLPTPEEIAGELYVPPSSPGDAELPELPECRSTPQDAVAKGPATLSAIADSTFVSSCAFSSCHQGGSAVLGLDLTAANLHEHLLGYDVKAATDKPLIAPGDPAGSYLYQLLSQCSPHDGEGTKVNHMPLNSPVLLDPGFVAQVRDWIAAGAPNN